jgi:hypothetical protein
MAKGVVEVHGKDVEVREDTFKAYRGIRWAVITIVAFAIIVAIMAIAGFFTSIRNGGPTNPAQTERPAQ